MATEYIVIFHEDERGIARSWSEVGKIVRCKDCKHWGMHKRLNVPWCFAMHIDKSEDGFCDGGERSEDGKT